jgi:hypothetical protein
MSLTLFKSTKSSQGAMFSIKFAAKLNKKEEDFKTGAFFVTITKQVGYDEKTQKGRFSGGDTVRFKLDQFEAAKILDVIERNNNLGDVSKYKDDSIKPFSFYNQHGFQGVKTHINFNPWQRKTDKEQSGFALRVTQVKEGGNSTFGMAFPFGEAVLLREYIKLGLEHIFLAEYAEDKRRASEYSNGQNENQDEAPETPKRQTRKAAPEPEPESPADEEEPLF